MEEVRFMIFTVAGHQGGSAVMSSILIFTLYLNIQSIHELGIKMNDASPLPTVSQK